MTLVRPEQMQTGCDHGQFLISQSVGAGEGGQGDGARPGAEAQEEEGPRSAAGARWRGAGVVRCQLGSIEQGQLYLC